MSGGILYFTANDRISGYEPWRSDGTSAGTMMLKDVWPGSSGSKPAIGGYRTGFSEAFPGRVFFRAADAVSGYELWQSDGTPETTVRTVDFVPGPAPSTVSISGPWVGNYYLSGYDATVGYELWAMPAAAPHAVPDGSSGPPLLLANSPSDLLTLSWSAPSCAEGVNDYEVYEGFLGSWYSHTSRQCTTNGLTSVDLPSPSASVYYLVVPRSESMEGSYGLDGSGVERPIGSNACLAQVLDPACP
jgi:ELWxxDGT repeat protein